MGARIRASGKPTVISSRPWDSSLADTMSLKGKGRVLRGADVLAEVSYEVTEHKNYENSSHFASQAKNPAMSDWTLRLEGLPKKLWRISDRLTLEMNDGRKLNFFMQTDGSTKVTGRIQPAS
jgi:hypothetical protein